MVLIERTRGVDLGRFLPLPLTRPAGMLLAGFQDPVGAPRVNCGWPLCSAAAIWGLSQPLRQPPGAYGLRPFAAVVLVMA
jgi:hypothetical protein